MTTLRHPRHMPVRLAAAAAAAAFTAVVAGHLPATGSHTSDGPALAGIIGDPYGTCRKVDPVTGLCNPINP